MNDAKQTLRVEAKGYLKPLAIAEHLATRAMTEGSALDAQAALVFFAFAIEAFCNHVGLKLANDLDAFENLRVAEKLRETAKLISFDLDLGRRPFQTFHGLIKFRDGAAHGRTEHLRSEKDVAWPTSANLVVLPQSPPTHWVASCTPEALQRARIDVNEGLQKLYAASPLATASPFGLDQLDLKLTRTLKPEKGVAAGDSPKSGRKDSI